MATRAYENRFTTGSRGMEFQAAVAERARDLGVEVHMAESSQVGDDLAVGTYVKHVIRCTGSDAALAALEGEVFDEFDGRRIGQEP